MTRHHRLYPPWTIKRCFRCGWLFQCPREQAHRIYCTACADSELLRRCG